LREEKIAAADAFFIDDVDENVKAAAKLGLHVHHFKDALGLRIGIGIDKT
jgi:methionine salvage enolase-phosphatase E1